MLFSIITPSFKQLDWLRLCVASVRDQVTDEKAETGKMENEQGISLRVSSFKSQVSRPPLAVEHIIQDAGSPGIEEFAHEVGADFYQEGNLVFRSQFSDFNLSRYRIAIYCESDSGMYDAINRGLEKSSGETCAWLNCDEQYLPGTLAKVAAHFQAAKGLEILLGDALILDSDLQPVCYRRIMVPALWHTRLHHLHSLSCAMFFRRNALPTPPLNPAWRIISDLLLMDYFLTQGKSIAAIRIPLSTYAFTGANLGSSPEHGEHIRWRKEKNYQAPVLKRLSFAAHLFRRLLHGAYGHFPLDTRLFTFQSPDQRVPLAGTVPGSWPRNRKR